MREGEQLTASEFFRQHAEMCEEAPVQGIVVVVIAEPPPGEEMGKVAVGTWGRSGVMSFPDLVALCSHRMRPTPEQDELRRLHAPDVN